MNKIRLSAIFKLQSFIIFILSLITFVIPLIYSVYLEDEEILCYIIPIFISLLLFSLSAAIKAENITEKEALIIAVSVWFVFPVLTTISYLLSGYISDPIDAYFESVSGFTTTGASILTDIEKLPESLLLLRSLTNWVGGLGFVVLAVSVLSSRLPIGRSIVKFESSKIIEERIEPKVKEVARIVITVYLVMTLLQIFLLYITGIDLYNAITYTFSTVATGGFAPKNDSVAGLSSTSAEFIISLFMILGAINLQLYYIAFKKKSLKSFFKDPEVITYVGIISVAVGISTAVLYISGTYNSLWESFRYGMFQIVSAATTTGFSTTDYSEWHPSVLYLMLLLALIGAVSGSTGGGIKIFRLIFMFKIIAGEIKRIAHPKIIYRPSLKGKVLDISTVNMFWAFLSLYLFSLIFFSFILTLGGHDLVTSFSASIACITSLGPGLGEVGPASNFSSFSDFEKLMLSFEMIFGRLEIIPVITAVFIRSI
ncbi:TrkH family potassium uptake protein [Persephonella atlantica]|uniref:TrkH family potassium uptake protein n=1 Tax=Persephonella atlantica TaxID=2699429 RepID=A0ABS1GG99_9AQUI|nr:TrkH family potassium uptake protein [Persephonella atlantica]MBK3331942.1 TrkH family potassium uptake protein [Persephonella atlantica]